MLDYRTGALLCLLTPVGNFMSKFEIKGLTFTTLDQTNMFTCIRFINQLREIGDQITGSIFSGPMGVNTHNTIRQ